MLGCPRLPALHCRTGASCSSLSGGGAGVSPAQSLAGSTSAPAPPSPLPCSSPGSSKSLPCRPQTPAPRRRRRIVPPPKFGLTLRAWPLRPRPAAALSPASRLPCSPAPLLPAGGLSPSRVSSHSSGSELAAPCSLGPSPAFCKLCSVLRGSPERPSLTHRRAPATDAHADHGLGSRRGSQLCVSPSWKQGTGTRTEPTGPDGTSHPRHQAAPATQGTRHHKPMIHETKAESR